MASARKLISGVAYRFIRMTGTERGALRMLMYHRVTDAHPDERLCVRVDAFAEHMRRLSADGWRTVSFADAIEMARGKKPIPEKSLAITFDDGFEDNYTYALPSLAQYGFKACFFVPSAFIESAGNTEHAPDDRPMTWEQLHELIQQGHEVGAHSVTHRKLTLMPHAEAEWEIKECKAIIENRLTLPVRWFCYPAGACNAAIRKAVARAGYEGACTVRPGANRPGRDVFALTRTEISGFDTVEDFSKKLAGAYDWMHAALQAFQRLRKPRECANAMPKKSAKPTAGG